MDSMTNLTNRIRCTIYSRDIITAKYIRPIPQQYDIHISCDGIVKAIIHHNTLTEEFSIDNNFGLICKQ